LDIGEKKYSLGQIEHEILIDKFQEPLIHYAIVCASLSCPDIIPDVYTGTRLQAQLEKQAGNFLENPGKGLVYIKGAKLCFTIEGRPANSLPSS